MFCRKKASILQDVCKIGMKRLDAEDIDSYNKSGAIYWLCSRRAADPRRRRKSPSRGAAEKRPGAAGIQKETGDEMILLYEGCKNENVIALKARLNELGYDCGEGDVFDRRTAWAVRWFRRQNDLAQSSDTIDDLLWRASIRKRPRRASQRRFNIIP